MELPARIGKYELEEFLGGGMSHVYRARDTIIGRTVALKILTEAGCADEEVRARFLAEARMAGNLAHDHILSIYDFGEDDLQRPFMVMEFLRGEDLRNALRHGRTGDAQNKLKIAVQIAKGLAYIHTQKIIHRDIKPENVHINQAGVVKLMDFGIAKTEGLQMTRAGYVLGTPYYMAPEQVMGSEMTPQVDVYAFGILLFEIFTGVKPIQAETVERIFYFILNEPLKLEPMAEAGAPQPIVDLVARCTAKKPGDRPHGFEPVIAELERAMVDREEATQVLPVPEAAPAPAPPPAGRPAWLLPAVLLLIAGLSAALYFATRAKPPAPAPHVPAPIAEAVPEGMVRIPESSFLYGKDKQSVRLPAYYIDRTEVSNAAWARFKGTGAPADPDLPVVNITIQEARDYAAWAGKRLPTAQEWEKAARGTDGFLYPWGDTADAARANVNSAGPQQVGAFAEFASPFQTVQMIGNVWEFIDEKATPDAEERKYFGGLLRPPPAPGEEWHPIRGGSFKEGRLLNTVISQAVPARWKDPNLGFRCVRDAK
jgi:eukaryotic-like serine/threonine-protein kinase